MTYNLETMTHRELQKLLQHLWNTSGNPLRGKGHNFLANRKSQEMRESLRGIMATDWFKTWLVQEPKRQELATERLEQIKADAEQRRLSRSPLPSR